MNKLIILVLCVTAFESTVQVYGRTIAAPELKAAGVKSTSGTFDPQSVGLHGAEGPRYLGRMKRRRRSPTNATPKYPANQHSYSALRSGSFNIGNRPGYPPIGFEGYNTFNKPGNPPIGFEGYKPVNKPGNPPIGFEGYKPVIKPGNPPIGFEGYNPVNKPGNPPIGFEGHKTRNKPSYPPTGYRPTQKPIYHGGYYNGRQNSAVSLTPPKILFAVAVMLIMAAF